MKTNNVTFSSLLLLLLIAFNTTLHASEEDSYTATWIDDSTQVFYLELEKGNRL